MRPSIIGRSLAESDILLQQMDLESWQLTTLHLFVNILFLPSPPDQPLIVDRWNGPIGSQRLHVTSSQLCLERILPSKIDNCSDFYDLRQIVRFRKSALKVDLIPIHTKLNHFFILPPFISYTQAKNIKTHFRVFTNDILLFQKLIDFRLSGQKVLSKAIFSHTFGQRLSAQLALVDLQILSSWQLISTDWPTPLGWLVGKLMQDMCFEAKNLWHRYWMQKNSLVHVCMIGTIR